MAGKLFGKLFDDPVSLYIYLFTYLLYKSYMYEYAKNDK